MQYREPYLLNKESMTFDIKSKVDKKLISLEERVATLNPIRSSIKRMQDAKNQPEITELLSQVWQSNELHLLFADTGVGKSIFAVGLSLALCRGDNFIGLRNKSYFQMVLYYDFELSDKQFWKRYTDENGNIDPLSENFFIDNINFAELIDIAGGYNDKFIDVLFEKIKHDIKKTTASVLVIDNLTFLHTQSTQDTNIALDTMRRLNELKNEFNISILVLAHTPKRNQTSPLTINDLAGSKHLSNFADSISAIGKSKKDSNTRYFKQIKPSRSGEMLLDSSNVIEMEIIKKDTLLTFDFIQYTEEFEHLSENTSNRIPEKLEIVSEMVKEGITFNKIAHDLGISKGTISKWKNKYPDRF